MKKVLIFVFVMMGFVNTNAQKKEITKRFLTMQSALVKKDFKTTMDYTADEIFTVVPKEQMVSLMERTSANPQMEIEIELPKIISISDVFVHNAKEYAILDVSGIQKIRVSDENKKQLNLGNPLLLTLKLKFDVQYGPENVQFNDLNNFFTIVVDQKVVAITEKGSKDWKFLVMDKNRIQFLSKLLPEEVAEKI